MQDLPAYLMLALVMGIAFLVVLFILVQGVMSVIYFGRLLAAPFIWLYKWWPRDEPTNKGSCL